MFRKLITLPRFRDMAAMIQKNRGTDRRRFIKVTMLASLSWLLGKPSFSGAASNGGRGCEPGPDVTGLEDEVIEIISRQLDIDKKDVAIDSAFVDDLGADSLDLVELVMALEERFELEISDEEAIRIVRVRNAIDLILKQRPRRKHGGECEGAL